MDFLSFNFCIMKKNMLNILLAGLVRSGLDDITIVIYNNGKHNQCELSIMWQSCSI